MAIGLLLEASWRVQAVETGFRAEGVLTLKMVFPLSMPSPSRAEFYSRVLAGARAFPGITSAAYVSIIPMTLELGNFPVRGWGDLRSAVAESTGYVMSNAAVTFDLEARFSKATCR